MRATQDTHGAAALPTTPLIYTSGVSVCVCVRARPCVRVAERVGLQFCGVCAWRGTVM